MLCRCQIGKLLALNPGDRSTFTLSSRELEGVKKFLAAGGFHLASLNKVVIRIGYIIYDNGMRWEQGYWYRPNPNEPGKYERMSPQPSRALIGLLTA